LSISGTALVDVVGSGAAIQYGSGAAFLAERFIPQSRRAYRDIAPMVNSGTGTFFTNWQESGTNNNGFGTQITGKVGAYPGGVDATTGFDMTTTGNKSLSSYNVNTTTGTASFVNYTSTKNTSTDTLSAFKAYRLTIRGNRQNNLFVDNAASNATCILRSTGKLITGTVAYTQNGVTNNGNTNTNIRLNFGDVTGFAMLGNPYMAPIDWVNMMANSNNTNIQQTYWVLDPNVGTVGAYVTYNASTGSSNGSSQVNKYIQPGQGFFIKNNNSTSPTLEIREADKAASTTNLVTVFGESNNVPLSKMAFLLDKWIDTAYVSMDGDVVCFSNNFTDAIGVEDASKLTNQTENLGIISNGIMLSNEGRLPVKATDSIAFKLWQTTAGINYQLQINLSTFSANGLQPFLKDRFTKTQTLLQLGVVNKYQFTTLADTASYNNRFTIVFTVNAVLPISFKTITANKVNNQVKIDWSAIETNVAFYEVEHSLNGQEFTKILTVNATLNSNGSLQNYTANHTTPIAGNNYYRVKSIEQNGAINYSNTVLVNMPKAEASISIYPNPITNRIANIQIVNLAKFTYNVILYNTAGQRVYSTYINYKSGSEIHELALPQSLSSGTYQMAITGNGFSKVLSVIIK
ncbi:MAG: T9SS type A sorting domain-containing protein, partial [Pedobacter sp.]|nr:T9SS type A sorting domain-containing protein [Chitinophagaceae bacterium]